MKWIYSLILIFIVESSYIKKINEKPKKVFQINNSNLELKNLNHNKLSDLEQKFTNLEQKLIKQKEEILIVETKIDTINQLMLKDTISLDSTKRLTFIQRLLTKLKTNETK